MGKIEREQLSPGLNSELDGFNTQLSDIAINVKGLGYLAYRDGVSRTISSAYPNVTLS